MENLFLEDLNGMSENEIIQHLKSEYCGGFRGICGPVTNNIDESDVDNFTVLIAYESVGNWGCDSSSFFLLKNKKNKKLYEVHGSHCSCYGFEGQFEPEETSLEYLKSDHFYPYGGGYDDNWTENKKAIKSFIDKLSAEV